MTDFTNCRIIPGRAHDGANGSKSAVDYNGEIYMLRYDLILVPTYKLLMAD